MTGVRRWAMILAFPVLAAVGAVILSISTAALGDTFLDRWTEFWPTGTLVYGSSALILVGTVGSGVRSLRVQDVREKLNRCREEVDEFSAYLEDQQKDLLARLRDRLHAIATGLGFTAQERVSLYRHDGKRFVALGRYSEHPEYNKQGRAQYRDDEGFIGRVWRSAGGELSIRDLPDARDDVEAWAVALEEAGIGLPPKTLGGLRMRPRAMVGFALKDPKNRDRIGVVVFESRQPRGLRPEQLRDLLDGPTGIRLREFLVEHAVDMPRPTSAEAAGL